eukprot:TRINITY_DN66673_c1_g2_i1.p1 TRINITY_DN66673_c1_g2~~TRINITY_DN66673_c1_g2_i1.p1  ORF type:complete len:549 (-),score=40.04 TRINITY_DN66673_c1_g2_i1:1271-2812(-)
MKESPKKPTLAAAPSETTTTTTTTTTTESSPLPKKQPGDEIMYTTYSMCPICFQKGQQWIEACVVANDGKVYLQTECEKHGIHRTLYSSNLAWFRSLFAYDPSRLENSSKPSPDMEDLLQSMQFTSGHVTNLPLMCTVALHEANSGYIEDEAIKERITSFSRLYEKLHGTFVLKLTAMLSPNTATLNRKVKGILSWLPPEGLIMIESSHDRLIALINHPDSAFLDKRVYPALKLVVAKGKEESAETELKQFCKNMTSIAEMSTCVTLVVNRPVPNLAGLITIVRTKPGIVKGLVIHLERPLSLQKTLLTTPPSELPEEAMGLDSYTVLETLEKDTNGFLRAADFLPLSACMLLEPFIELLGHGKFTIRPSPLCGFVAAFVNTKQYTSAPITRLVDMPKLFSEMLPVVWKIHQNNGKIGVSTAKAIKTAVYKHLAPQVKLPDGFVELSFKGGKPTATINTENVYNSQFVIIHNTMDIGCIDLARRGRCVTCVCTKTATSNQPAKFTAECTKGCV